MTKFLGIEWAPLNVPLHRRLEILAATFWSGFQVLGEAISLIVFALWLYSDYWWMAVLYAVWIFYDRETPRTGGRKQEWMRNWSLWKHYDNYFPLEIIKTAELDPSKNYLLAMYPHGVLCFGLNAALSNNASPFQKLFPGMVSHSVTLAGHFLMPFFRDFILLLGCCSCSKESLLHLLDRKNYQGKCIGLLVGGAAEIMITDYGKHKAYIKSRKGFVRIAIKAGAPLVPVYAFGETETYEILHPPKGGIVERTLNLIRNILGVCPIPMNGRGFFQYSFGFLPKRAPLNIVFGAPIEVTMNNEPSNEEVDAVHKTFVKALVDLFDTHKHKYVKDPENAHLELF